MPIHNQFISAGPGQPPNPQALLEVGACLVAEVHVPPQIAEVLEKEGTPVPASQSGIALIDTGATISCVHEPLLADLGLKPVGVVNSGTAAGPIQQSLYMARLIFPVIGWTVDLQVAGVDLTGQTPPLDPPQPIIALLGRNLLSQALLIWNGPGGFWTFATHQ